MADKAHDLVDERLEAMEWRIRDIYEEAAKGIEEKAADYLRRFEKLDEAKRKQMEAGKITEAEYREWRQNKMLYGKRYTDLKKQVAAELANVNKTAIAYVNWQVPEIYALGYDAFSDVANGIPGYSFTAVNADTVRHLATTDSSLLPFKSLDLSKDIPWNMKRVNAEMLQGILQGESIPKMAARMSRVTDSNRAAATRAARTLVTEAENKGRQDSYERAKKDGVMLQRKWIATYDMRTRHAHAMLDGKLSEVDEPFESELGPIMFPGDHTAHPSNVYNCRCTMGVKYMGFNGKKTKIESVDDRPLASELVKEKTAKNGLTRGSKSGKIYGERVEKAIGGKSPSYPIVNYPGSDIPVDFVIGSRPIFPPDHTMAGNGCKTGRKIDDIERLVEEYNCSAEGWQKEKAIYEVYDEYSNIRQVELHWYQHPDIGKVEYKVKMRGESFYCDEWQN